MPLPVFCLYIRMLFSIYYLRQYTDWFALRIAHNGTENNSVVVDIRSLTIVSVAANSVAVRTTAAKGPT